VGDENQLDKKMSEPGIEPVTWQVKKVPDPGIEPVTFGLQPMTLHSTPNIL
jgi:hypothetical protein